MRHTTLISTLAFFILLVTGCTVTNQVKSIGTLDKSADDKPSIVLMPLDVELSILTASGLLEPQAEWTQSANRYIHDAMQQEFAQRSARFVSYDNSTTDATSTLVQLEKLHEVVGYAALVHHVGQAKLPSKQGRFDWTLGEDVSALKQASGADYAMFVFIRDSYASGGRVALQVGAALLGVGVPGGQQIGFASMVDLDTGEIVWFNFLHSASGDLREADNAQSTVGKLLEGLPEA